MQKRLLIGTLVLTAALLFIGLFPVHGEEEIYRATVRLHVLANSNSVEDQTLKLEVRDAVLACTAPLLADCRTREDAVAVLTANEGEIQAAAERVIANAGREDAVEILLGDEEYPERTYDSVCFPSGEYVSLRVCIGDAAGHNWWCCLFPPLCLNTAKVSAKNAEDAFLAVGLTPEQYKIVTETDKPVYQVRFKILELFQ